MAARCRGSTLRNRRVFSSRMTTLLSGSKGSGRFGNQRRPLVRQLLPLAQILEDNQTIRPKPRFAIKQADTVTAMAPGELGPDLFRDRRCASRSCRALRSDCSGRRLCASRDLIRLPLMAHCGSGVCIAAVDLFVRAREVN